MNLNRRQILAAGAASLSVAAVGAGRARAQASGPIRIGSTLALTGPLAATGRIHQVAGQVYIDNLNQRGGLLGRQVEWVLRDDTSQADVCRTLYEQLITVDKVDLIMGPYATADITAAMAVAQRYQKLLIHHTFGTPALAKYDMQFQAGGISANPESTWPEHLFQTVATAPRPPKTVSVVSSKFPSMHFVSDGARAVAKKHGLQELLWLDWDFGAPDLSPIAARVKDANADLLWVGSLGTDSVQLIDAMTKIGYAPPLQFYMFPAPGPMIKVPAAQNALALTAFEEHPPFTTDPFVASILPAYHAAMAKASMPDPALDTQGASSLAAWQCLEAAIVGTRSLDDKALADWLRKNHVDSAIGRLEWAGPYNYIADKDLYKIKQLQGPKWLVVYPAEFAAPGARLITA